jgi:NAD(P)-dependent dehydrogenase (short-subunit alcohol dehydrogenase family)
MSPRPLALIAGCGPGLGAHLLQKLDTAGFDAFGLSRHPAADGRVLPLDLSDPAAVSDTISRLISRIGPPRLVIHNTAHLHIAPFADTQASDFEEAWRNMVLSAVHVAHAVMPAMVAEGRGAFLVSGASASLRGGARFSAFASAKAGLRSLTQSLAREYGPKGVHVAHVVLDGILDTIASRTLQSRPQESMMALADVAQTYLTLAEQPRSAWTFEMDLRPMGESF